MAWRAKTGLQVDGFASYVSNVISFWLTTGKWRWYVAGAYVPPNNDSTAARVEHALGNAEKGVELILLIGLNVRLQELRYVREEELATVVAACGLEDMTAHFMPRRRYIGGGRWTWRMRREDRKVKGWGEYILYTSRHKFFNVGIGEAQMNIDHRMFLAVLQGEGAQRNGAYRRRRR